MSGKEIQFFFDYSSPFAYLGATQIEAVAARHGATIRWRPFLLGALFKAIGTPTVPIMTMAPAKQKHASLDLFRWADHWSVPFSFPTRFPMMTIKPLRLTIAAPEASRPALALAVFRAYWAEDRDIADDATLIEIANGVGLDGAALMARTAEPAVKDALRVATEEAEKAGVCGAPSFLVGDQLFWGQDRLLFVEKALEGWRPTIDV